MQVGFTWHELFAPQPEAAVAFLAGVCGGAVARAPLETPGGGPFLLLIQERRPVLGVMQPPRPGSPSWWDGYVAVPDLDAALERASALGARVVFDAPMAAEGWGRFSFLIDPQGAGLGVIQPSANAAIGGPNPGVGWQELAVDDPEAALAFYGALFDWREVGRLERPAGPCLLLGYGSERTGRLTVVRRSEGEAAGWRYYLHVGRLDPALAAAQERGATIATGPRRVPGGGFAAVGVDPQGVDFALHAPRR
ncbi:VOC family protein [Oceanithermus sp.]|uniref:VOC family protein n=2 Tax=Oceanithermus sp. TaxID=2268145 RepID=UPI00257A928E|nr:VOC family protein [Oceanithermus sp.]